MGRIVVCECQIVVGMLAERARRETRCPAAGGSGLPTRTPQAAPGAGVYIYLWCVHMVALSVVVT